MIIPGSFRKKEIIKKKENFRPQPKCNSYIKKKKKMRKKINVNDMSF